MPSHDRGGVQELDITLVVHHLRWFFCLLGRGSFHLFLVFPLFLCFGLFFIGRVSSLKTNSFLSIQMAQRVTPLRSDQTALNFFTLLGNGLLNKTVLQTRGFSRLPLECGGNLKRYREEKANSQALTASGALPKSMYNRFLESLRDSWRGNQLVCLDLPWLAMYLQQVRPGAKQTRWTQLFFSFFTLSFHQIYLSTEIVVEEPAAPTSQARF